VTNAHTIGKQSSEKKSQSHTKSNKSMSLGKLNNI